MMSLVRFQSTFGREGGKINLLEELLGFLEEIGGEIVLRKFWIDWQTPCLEIYDDY